MENQNSQMDPWQEQSARSDAKQHCNKISQGLDKLDGRSTSRAIWELIQNARDLAQTNHETGEKECYIDITLTPDELIFAHKGKPFTFDSLNSLVKQVSSEEKENDDTAGQFGTGFLTTHSFGRKILVEGSLSMKEYEEGKFVDVNDFIIDRTFTDITEFVEKMTSQIGNIFNYRKSCLTNVCREWTKLKYQLSTISNAFEKAQDGIAEALKVMPYVMTINDRLKEVTINDTTVNRVISFTRQAQRQESDLNVTDIKMVDNGVESIKSIYYLQSDDAQDIVIMPLKNINKAERLENIAKLFVHFPLLGTEDFGMEYIFHSQRFHPEEARDNIILPRDNVNIVHKYSSNVQILKEMSQMVFDYLEKHAHEIDNIVDISMLRFDRRNNKESMTNEFFQEFHDLWVNNLKNYSMIVTPYGKKSILDENVMTFGHEILEMLYASEGQTERLPEFYDLVRECFVLPNFAEVIKWSLVVLSWGIKNCILTARDIAYAVENHSLKNTFDITKLHSFLAFLKDGGKTELFTEYSLIPNRDGYLCRANGLCDAAIIDSEMYKLLEKIIPDEVIHFVNPYFVDIYDFLTFDEEDLTDSIAKELAEYSKEKTIDGQLYSDELFVALVKYCSYFYPQSRSSVRKNVMPVLAKFHNVEYQEKTLQNFDLQKEDVTKTAFQYLLKTTLLYLSTFEKLDDNTRSMLYEILENIYEYKFFSSHLTGLGKLYGIYPNEKGELCMAEDLCTNVDIDVDLKVVANGALDYQLEDVLVDSEFAKFWNFDKLQAKDIAEEIEEKLKDGELASDILLDIIDKLDNHRWEDIFPYIKANKEKLFFEQVQGEKKEAIYKIMKVKDNNLLSLLSFIAEQGNALNILSQAQSIIEEKERLEAEFRFKKLLGNRIEKLLKEQLDVALSENIDVVVEDNQIGQDIVILHEGKEVFFIEIKSKWNFDNPAYMSKLQVRKAMENPNNYALCCVDLSDFNALYDYPEMAKVLANTYVHLDIAQQLEPIMRGIISSENSNKITLTGDYRCSIPKQIFLSGYPFEILLDRLADILQK